MIRNNSNKLLMNVFLFLYRNIKFSMNLSRTIFLEEYKDFQIIFKSLRMPFVYITESSILICLLYV